MPLPPLVSPSPETVAAPTESTPELLNAIAWRDVPAVRAALDEAYGPFRDLARMGLVLINEQQPAALAQAWDGLALLRPGVLARADDGFREEVVAWLGLIAGTSATDPVVERLVRWTVDLLAERPTNLALTAQDLEGYDVPRMRAVAQRVEALVLDGVIPVGPAGAPAAHDAAPGRNVSRAPVRPRL